MRSGPATRTAFAMRESHGCPSPRFSADPPETFCNVPSKPALSSSSASAPKCSRIRIAPTGRSPAMRDRSLRRPQRPGRPQRFHALGTFSSLLSTLLTQTRKATVAEPALRDHWQRDIHACSESTVSHPETLRNHYSRPRCANPVDDEDCLWKEAEKVEKIRPRTG